MKKYYKRSFKYLFLFLFFFVCLQFIYVSFMMDTYPNYAFSYALSKGEIPYIDFNLIVPIFSPFLYSLGFIISHSLTFFYLEQAFLLMVLAYILFQLLGRKAWLFLIMILIPFPFKFPYILYPGYNFLCFFLLCLLLLMEKKNVSNRYIGLILGSVFLTKQTIGLLFILMNLVYYRKNLKVFFERFFYSLLPVGIFILYLVFTKSFKSFINLCFLGMLDFEKNNKYFSLFYLGIVIIICLFFLLKYLKGPKNISYYYALAFLSVIFPILDDYHFSLFLVVSGFIFLYNSNIKVKAYLETVFLMIMLVISSSWLFLTSLVIKDIDFYKYKNFSFHIQSRKEKENYDKLITYLGKKDYISLFGVEKNVFMAISNEKDINYYTILNYGNYGFDGTRMMLEKIKGEKDKYFVLDSNLSSKLEVAQYMVELKEYIERNSKLVKQIDNYKIYYKK